MWTRVSTLIANRKPADYDAAVVLLADLRSLAERDGQHDAFKTRAIALRRTHERKLTLIERLDQVGI